MGHLNLDGEMDGFRKFQTRPWTSPSGDAEGRGLGSCTKGEAPSGAVSELDREQWDIMSRVAALEDQS